MKVVNVKVNGQSYKAVFKNDSFKELVFNGKNEADTIEVLGTEWGVWFPYKGDTSNYPTDHCENGFSLFVGFAIEDGKRTANKVYAQVWNDDSVIEDF